MESQEKEKTSMQASKEKLSEIQRRYRKKNSIEIKERNKQRYDKKRQYINDYKLSKGCSVCGYNKCAFALDFHHYKEKNFEIPRMANGHYTLNKIKEEIKKCVILCANCHRELHDNNN